MRRTPTKGSEVWFVGGGTGGHLAPGLALAEWLEANAGLIPRFLTSGRAAERAMLGAAGVEAIEHPLPIPVGRWNQLMYGAALTREATALGLRFWRKPPAAVVGLGAYGSVPAALAAAATSVPLFLLEQNTVPGRANRMLARWASEIYLQWGEAAEHLAVERERCLTLGNPVRKVALSGSRLAAAERFGLDANKRTLLVMGGSQGSSALNQLMVRAAPLLERHADRMQLLIIAGEGAARVLKGAFEHTRLSPAVLPFVAQMGDAYALADLALCRAGGTSIAELFARSVPALLVPFPRAADDHQTRNASAAAASGGAILLRQDELTPEGLLEHIETLLLDGEARLPMVAAASAAGAPHATERIGRRLLERLGSDGGRREPAPRPRPRTETRQQPRAAQRSLPRVAAATTMIEPRKVHLIGAGGSGVSSLGAIYLARGFMVTGSDMRETAGVQRLRQLGACIDVGHASGRISPLTDHVVASASIGADNLELIDARRQQIPVLKYAEALGKTFKKSKHRIAVAGTHGKTTTSGWVSHVLAASGHDPSYVLGAAVQPLGSSAAYGRGPFVVEACEFDRSFLNLDPTIGIVTNIEADHLDYYSGLPEIEQAFLDFANRIEPGGLMIAHHSVRQLFSSAQPELPCRVVGYGPRGCGATWEVASRPVKGGGLKVELYRDGRAVGRTSLSLSGQHNAENGLSALIAAMEVGVPFEQARLNLGDYLGASRRLEKVADHEGITVFDDYAHHPTEIAAVLAAIRGSYSGRRVTAIFQPHQHSRTRLLLEDFCKALAGADRVIVPDIFASRDRAEDVAAVGSPDLVARLVDRGVAARFVSDFGEIVRGLMGDLAPGDVVITMGAGDVNRVAGLLRAELEGQPC